MDQSRQLDMRRMQAKIDDPKVPDSEKKKAEDAIYAIKLQQKSPAIQRLREQMTVAVKNGDAALAERIGKEAKKIDRDWRR